MQYKVSLRSKFGLFLRYSEAIYGCTYVGKILNIVKLNQIWIIITYYADVFRAPNGIPLNAKSIGKV